jgi:glycosyltransferase involved in cell wall biosynthesis
LKLVYIISDINKAITFEWLAEAFAVTDIEVHFLILNPGESHLETWLREHHYSVKRIHCAGKRSFPKAFIETFFYLKKLKPDVVHCHLQKACLIGLTAAYLLRVPKRIHSRHHSSLHHVYFPKGIWLDKYFNAISTHVVAISSIVKEILVDWEKVPEKKVVLIHHGLKFDDYAQVSEARKEVIREKYSLQQHTPIVGVVSRFSEWKGVQYIVPAFQNFLKEYPRAVLLLFNGFGDYSEEIQKLLKSLPESSYRVIAFENDMQAAYKIMDLFIHVPIDHHSEAFGQVYVEALIAGVPSIFTLSGIAYEFFNNKINSYIVSYKNSDEIEGAMYQVVQGLPDVRINAKTNQNIVSELFSLEKMVGKLYNLYNS